MSTMHEDQKLKITGDKNFFRCPCTVVFQQWSKGLSAEDSECKGPRRNLFLSEPFIALTVRTHHNLISFYSMMRNNTDSDNIKT